MGQNSQLSVPVYRKAPRRSLTADETSGLFAAAAALMPGAADMPSAAEAEDFEIWLDRALAARDDIFDEVTAAGEKLAGLSATEIDGSLRAMARDDAVLFGKLSTILAGAYLLVPEVQRAIKYPGQVRRYPPFDEAAEQIMSGILDPVIARGTICVGIEPAESVHPD